MVKIYYYLAFLNVFLGMGQSQTTTSQLRQHTITVHIFPTASSTTFVACWSNSTVAPFNEMSDFNYTGEISWTVRSTTANLFDSYWCRARMGSNILIRFPVYGDGVERSDSEWVINSRGRRRIALNGRPYNDQTGNWLVT